MLKIFYSVKDCCVEIATLITSPRFKSPTIYVYFEYKKKQLILTDYVNTDEGIALITRFDLSIIKIKYSYYDEKNVYQNMIYSLLDTLRYVCYSLR